MRVPKGHDWSSFGCKTSNKHCVSAQIRSSFLCQSGLSVFVLDTFTHPPIHPSFHPSMYLMFFFSVWLHKERTFLCIYWQQQMTYPLIQRACTPTFLPKWQHWFDKLIFLLFVQWCVFCLLLCGGGSLIGVVVILLKRTCRFQIGVVWGFFYPIVSLMFSPIFPLSCSNIFTPPQAWLSVIHLSVSHDIQQTPQVFTYHPTP